MEQDTNKSATDIARFERVAPDGLLILTLDDATEVGLEVTDELEQAVLVSKQLRNERQENDLPVQEEQLPLSNIQSMIREGMSADDVAEHYSLDPVFVRRFAQPIETEKRYAINQFLAVNAPLGSTFHSLSDLISNSLQELDVDFYSVTWSATKKGRNPWKIVALFTMGEQPGRATWMWDMRDNSVVSIDPLAKRLLGEMDAAPDTLLFGPQSSTAAGDQISQSAQAQPEQSPQPETLFDDTPVDDPTPSTQSLPAAPKAKTAQSSGHSQKRRQAIPSWDEIISKHPTGTNNQ